jgi:U6 snRNA-associated Sm-like protein LSm8
MASHVESLVDQIIVVITTEGRVFTGVLKSFDQSMNLVIKNCYEKVYSTDEGVKFVKMNVYMIRGDTVAMITDIDETLEGQINYNEVKAEPLKVIKTHF